MKFPVNLSFKILALASQIYIRDAQGDLIGYVKQKMFKLKEDINVFSDEAQTDLKFNIKADRVIDFSATYNFTDQQGRPLGSIKRRGLRSIWKADYDVFDAEGREYFKINEENGWIKVLDSLIGEIPVANFFTGYFLNPSYIISRRADDRQVARLQKQNAFFEGKFQLSAPGQISDDEEILILLGSLTMVLLERSRG